VHGVLLVSSCKWKTLCFIIELLATFYSKCAPWHSRMIVFPRGRWWEFPPGLAASMKRRVVVQILNKTTLASGLTFKYKKQNLRPFALHTAFQCSMDGS
jgi:hypothetical protein